MLNKVRILSKIIFCISLIIAFSLTSAYLVNLQPNMDGLLISNIISRWIYGENGWTIQMLHDGFLRSVGCSVLLCIVNIILDIIALIKSK